jgi:glycosyltransferase involved in cell wall biosynthesis
MEDSTIIGSASQVARAMGKARSTLDALPLQFYRNRQRYPALFPVQWLPSRVTDQIKLRNPDVVNLHWICDGFVSIEALAKLNKPIVWTCHDMWAFTGGCCYSQGCEGYTKSCGNCPQLGSSSSWDLSRWIWQRKAKAWQNLKLAIVTPSNWLAERARASSLFQNTPVTVIAYGLDIETYKPTDRQTARHKLNLPQNKQLILFGAIAATVNKRKGFHLLEAALQKLSKNGYSDNIEALIFGASQPENPADLGLNIRYLGKISDPHKLALVYSAADVMVVPSVEEAFGQTATESLACGTPVVSFDSTGLKDIVEHQKNGYRAECFNPEDLANGIVWVIENKERHQKLGERAREKAEQEFTLARQASRYLSVFREVCNAS